MGSQHDFIKMNTTDFGEIEKLLSERKVDILKVLKINYFVFILAWNTRFVQTLKNRWFPVVFGKALGLYYNNDRNSPIIITLLGSEDLNSICVEIP